MQNSAGRKSIQYDDDAVNLNGKKLQVFFFKNEEGYFRVLNRVAPVPQDGDVISFSEDDASYWKKQAEKYYEQYKKPAESNGEMIEMTTDEIKETVTSSTDDVPF